MDEGSRGWILWVSLAIMCAQSIVSLVPLIMELSRATRKVASNQLLSVRFRGYGIGQPQTPPINLDDEHEIENETEDRLVPLPWVLWGIFASVTFGTIIVQLLFGSTGLKFWATLMAFFIGSILALLG